MLVPELRGSCLGLGWAACLQIATGSCCALWFGAKTAVLSRGREVRRGVASSDGVAGMACSSFGLGQGLPWKRGKLGMGSNWPLNGRLIRWVVCEDRRRAEKHYPDLERGHRVGHDSRGTAAVDGSCLPLLPFLLSYANQTSDCRRGNVLSSLGLGSAA